MKKIYKILMLVIIFLAIQFTYGICTANATDVKIKDENMYNKVLVELRNRYNLNPKTSVDETADNTMYIISMEAKDIANVRELQLNNIDMSSLHGIEFFTNLESLNISNNNLSSLAKLSGLTNLVTLTAYGNRFADLSALSTLTALKYLNISKNKLVDGNDNMDSTGKEDISALYNLTNLEEVVLGKNDIWDISQKE